MAHEQRHIATYEGSHPNLSNSYFAGLGLDIKVEDSTSHGRLDMAPRFGGNVYLFEFKVVEMTLEGAAMAQLREKRYADKYRGSGDPIHLVAVEFSKDTRNVAAFEVESGRMTGQRGHGVRSSILAGRSRPAVTTAAGDHPAAVFPKPGCVRRRPKRDEVARSTADWLVPPINGLPRRSAPNGDRFD